MWGNQLSDNYNTTTEFVNERKKTNFVKHSEQWDYLNRIEMKKNKPMNMFIWEHRMSKCLFFFVYKFCVLTSMLSVRLKQTNNIEVKTQNLLHRKQTNLGPLRKLCYFYDWFISILNLLHASVCFDHLHLSQGIVFCWV